MVWRAQPINSRFHQPDKIREISRGVLVFQSARLDRSASRKTVAVLASGLTDDLAGTTIKKSQAH
jgi:hypothetical protein